MFDKRMEEFDPRTYNLMTRDQYFADKSELKMHFSQINTAMSARLIVLETERAKLNDFKDASEEESGEDEEGDTSQNGGSKASLHAS